MPRYINKNKIVFTNALGKNFIIKEQREISKQDTARIIKDLPKSFSLDEIASRDNVFGPDGELLSYTIFDKNIIQLAENNFDLSKIRQIIIPVLREI